MYRLLLAYVGTLVTFCLLDLLWLGFVAKGFYQAQVGPLLLARPNWGAALLLYALYSAGVVFFVVAPAQDAAGWTRALAHGALFGSSSTRPTTSRTSRSSRTGRWAWPSPTSCGVRR